MKAQARDSHGVPSKWSACKDVLINEPPVLAGPPSGLAGARVGELVVFSTAEAIDPEGNTPVQYRFSWGDGTPPSSWSTSPSVMHAWTRAGAFCVRVQAKDGKEARSQWSECSGIQIDK